MRYCSDLVRWSVCVLFCVVTYAVTAAMLMPDSTDDLLNDGLSVTSRAGVPLHDLKGFFSNVRSLPQASGDLSVQVLDHDSDVFFLTECHLKEGTPVKQLIPKGYKVAARRDRNQHGGGLLAGCQKHLLASELDLSKYNIKMEAELCGFELNGTDYILCYTSHSRFVVRLFDKMQQYVLDNPSRPTVFLGDFNIHNQEWLNSRTITDKGGSVAQEFCENFGFFQYVDFDTRDGNTLDLVMSPFDGSASAVANLGTSDHVSIRFTMHDCNHSFGETACCPPCEGLGSCTMESH